MLIYPSTEIISLEIRKTRNIRRHFHELPQPVETHSSQYFPYKQKVNIRTWRN
jgi:hypothetical protein